MATATKSRTAVRSPAAIEAGLAQRVTECERRLDVLWASSVGNELRGIELRRQQRQVERQRESELGVERVQAAGRRLERFGDFAREKLAFARGLNVSALALSGAYAEWADRERIFASDPLRMTDDELAAALAEVGEVAPAGIRCPGYRGQGDFRQPGFEGVGVCPAGKSPDDVTAELLLANEEYEQERADRRADHAAEAAREDRALQTKIDRDAGLAALGRQARSAK